MKRFLSITLCVMMLASLFAVNVSAAIPTSYKVVEGAADEIPYINQDFSNTATTTDFTAKNYNGVVSVDENGVMHMTGGYASCAEMDTTSTTAIGSGNYTFEFDFCRTGEVAADYRLFVTFMRAANASSSTTDLQKYGVVIPIGTSRITKGTWYTYHLTVTEDAYAASNQNPSSLMQVKYKAKTADTWTTLGHYGSWNFVGQTDKCRVVPGSNAVAWNPPAGTEVIVGVQADPYGETKFDTETMDGTKEDFAFDNIKCYVPAVAGEEVEYPLPINQGVAMTDTAETTKTIASSTTYYTKTINWAAEPTKIVATFDAVTTVAGGPLSFATAGKAAGSAMTTIAPGTIGQWYNYKIVYSSNGSVVTADAVYRKAEGENTWTLLEKLGAKAAVSDGQWCVGYNGSNSYDNVRWYLYGALTGGNATSNCDAGTSWTVKNIQITDGNAVTGKATVDGSNLVVELNTALYSAADVIVATYDGTKLANVSYAPVAITGNKATVTVPYATGNTVKLYAWDALATGVPVLSAPITVNVAQ